MLPHPVGVAPNVHAVAVVEEPVDEGGGDNVVAHDLAPLFRSPDPAGSSITVRGNRVHYLLAVSVLGGPQLAAAQTRARIGNEVYTSSIRGL